MAKSEKKEGIGGNDAFFPQKPKKTSFFVFLASDLKKTVHPSLITHRSIRLPSGFHLRFHRSIFGEWAIKNSLGYCCGLFV